MVRALFLLSAMALVACSPNKTPSEPVTAAPNNQTQAPVSNVVPDTQVTKTSPPAKPDPDRPRMLAACGSCHGAPDPSEFTDRTWAQAIPYMYRIHAEFFSDRPALPPMNEVRDYYERNSAREVQAPALYPPRDGLGFSWTHRELTGGPSMVVSLRHGHGVDVLSGRVFELNGPEGSHSVQATGRHPVRAIHVDLDGDQELEWVVAELGAFVAKDTHLGSVTIVRGERRTPVLNNIGRVADISAGDLNGDGRMDLVVAEFGWQTSGGLHILFQEDKPLTFRKQTLSTDAGVVALGIADMDGDKRPDIVTSVSQHHERIDLWTNGGTGFKQTTIFRASTPLWGALGLLLTDLDGDGRVDVVHWNGDTLDAPKLANFQGVHWLNNLPKRFVAQQLAELPGVHDVTVTDLNQDGALDLVAVANLPPRIGETLWPSTQVPKTQVQLESILMLEQVNPGKFLPQSLLRNQACFSSITATDWDKDGDMDLVLGSFGLGWTLMGHHGDGGRSANDGAACRSGGLFWLENTKTTPSQPTRGQTTVAEQIKGLQTIVRNDQTDSRNRVNLGDALMQAGRFGEAEAILRDAIRINPQEKAAYINLALALDSRGRSSEAEEVCREIIKRMPQFGDAYNQLGAILSHQNRIAEAIKASRTAVRLDPKRIDYRLNLGSGLAQNGDLDGAEAEIRSVLKMQPNHPRARSHLQRVQRAKAQRGVAPR